MPGYRRLTVEEMAMAFVCESTSPHIDNIDRKASWCRQSITHDQILAGSWVTMRTFPNFLCDTHVPKQSLVDLRKILFD